jgi:hypothetical protein
MDPRDGYQKACDLADMLLARGYPVVSYECVDGVIAIRFGGPRSQDIHADAGQASLEGFMAAYGRPPPAVHDGRGALL